MGRRGSRRPRLAVKKETLRRLGDVSASDLAGVVGGINTTTSVNCTGSVLCTASTGSEPDTNGRTTSKHCLSGDI